MDRRVAFFLVAAVASGLMTFVAPDDYRYVAIGVSVTYLVLALLATFDLLSRRARRGGTR